MIDATQKPEAKPGKLTEEDVDLILQLHEDYGLGYKTIADKFEVSKGMIRDICLYRKRCLRIDS